MAALHFSKEMPFSTKIINISQFPLAVEKRFLYNCLISGIVFSIVSESMYGGLPITTSNPPSIPNIQLGSKNLAALFWSNISQSNSIRWSSSLTARNRFSSSTIWIRSCATSSLYFLLVFTVFAPKILCFATFISSCIRLMSSVTNKLVWLWSPISVLAATNLASRLGSGRMPKLSTGLSLVFWSTTREIKKRSLLICMAMGWMSTP